MVELCPCSATNAPEENRTTCLCAIGCGPPDATNTETTTGEMNNTSEDDKRTCACGRDQGTPDVCTTERVAVCCQWSGVKSTTEKKEVYCECVRGSPGISIIGRPPSPPILVSDASNEELKVDTTKCTPFNCPLPKDSSSSCSVPCPGPSILVCPNSSTPPTCSDLHTLQICPALKSPETCSVQSSRRSCLKIEAAHKTVKIQTPELRNKSQECVVEMFNKNQNEGHCNVEECIQNREKKDALANTGFCQAMANAVNHASSGVFKDSSGACSLMDSASGSCDANAQASYYHNKLVSTLQILQNREETIRVQAESLAVAEERISALTERASELRRDLERKSKEMHALQLTLERCKVEKVDVSVTAKGDSEFEKQSDIMNILQSNLSVIEDLYRECFYETAKQEDLIDLLRKSYLDVRLMEKQKADQIGRLQNVINTQKLSLDKCQEIALEVDTLKMEISNFLSSSTSTNNDSGMWERSEESFAPAPEVHEELQEVMEQLLRLRELLSDPCTCGLQNEIRRLNQKNEALERQTTELWQRNCELEKMLQAKDEAKDILEKKYKEEVKAREEQLKCVRRELATMLESSRDQTVTCEQLSTQLRQTEELLKEKSEELVRIHQRCDTQQETMRELKEEMKRAEELYEENCKLGGEVSSLTAQVAQWRAQLVASDRRVRKLDAKLRHALDCYSEKEINASELQSQLEEAHARGAALCGDVRRVLCAMRHWARRMRDARREQDNAIKEKDKIITALQDRLQNRASNVQCMCAGATEEPPRSVSSRQASCSRLEAARSQLLAGSENEMASCSSAPTPPRRLLRKKPCGILSYRGTRWFCDEGQQLPERQDACQDPRESYCEVPESTTPSAVTMGHVSPTDEMFRRMERLSEALADGYRRWTKSDAR